MAPSGSARSRRRSFLPPLPRRARPSTQAGTSGGTPQRRPRASRGSGGPASRGRATAGSALGAGARPSPRRRAAPAWPGRAPRRPGQGRASSTWRGAGGGRPGRERLPPPSRSTVRAHSSARAYPEGGSHAPPLDGRTGEAHGGETVVLVDRESTSAKRSGGSPERPQVSRASWPLGVSNAPRGASSTRTTTRGTSRAATTSSPAAPSSTIRPPSACPSTAASTATLRPRRTTSSQTSASSTTCTQCLRVVLVRERPFPRPPVGRARHRGLHPSGLRQNSRSNAKDSRCEIGAAHASSAFGNRVEFPERGACVAAVGAGAAARHVPGGRAATHVRRGMTPCPRVARRRPAAPLAPVFAAAPDWTTHD